MADEGRRAAVTGRLRAWERELEGLRLWLASAPEAVHLEHQPRLAGLCRQKELVQSRWEGICGVYRPAPEAVERFEAAWAEMERAWREEALPLLAAAGPGRPAGGS